MGSRDNPYGCNQCTLASGVTVSTEFTAAAVMWQQIMTRHPGEQVQVSGYAMSWFDDAKRIIEGPVNWQHA